jgi:hypothetical protein
MTPLCALRSASKELSSGNLVALDFELAEAGTTQDTPSNSSISVVCVDGEQGLLTSPH